MSKFFRGDLLILTNKGLKRIDKIEKTDLILSIWKVTNERNKEFQINYDEIKSIFDSKYKINK